MAALTYANVAATAALALGGAALATAVGIRTVFFATAGIMLFIAGWVVRTLTPSGGAPVARQQGAPDPRPAGAK